MRSYSPGGTLNAFAPADTGLGPHLRCVHRLGLGLPGYLILFAPPAFVLSASEATQSAVFTIGVPPDIYAFYRYTWSSALPFGPRAAQYWTPFPGLAGGFHAQLMRPPTHPLSPMTPNNVRTLCITAAAGTELAGAYSSAFVNRRGYWPRRLS